MAVYSWAAFSLNMVLWIKRIMMKTFRLFGLSFLALISIILFTTNISYGHNIHASSEQVVSTLNTILNISVIRRVEPAYPPLAKATRTEGIVIVELTINGTGIVTSTKILSGHPLLQDSSVNAARGWKFTPTGDSSEKVIGTITFNYSLPGWREELEKARLQAENNPDSLKALAKLAEAYAINYRYDEAIESYKKVIRLKPDYDEGIYRRLASLDYRKGVEIYEEGLRVFPKSVSLMKNLAREFDKVGKHVEAIEQYQKALIVEPNNPDFLFEIADFYHNILRFEESLTFLQKIIEIEPDNYSAHEKAGFACLQSGKLDKAEQYLKKALSIFDFSSGWGYLGDVYQQKGDVAAAAQAWKKAAADYKGIQLKRIDANLKLEPINTRLKL
jgi:TonB family protein